MDFDKILKIIKKTGDRCVVIDKESGEVFVVMDLQNYEKLVFNKDEVRHLTESQLLDRINQDISIWQSTQRPAVDELEEDDFDSFEEDEQEDVEEDKYYVEPVE